tara:strand:+ start:907 stop:1056 length:150 start_codon:yes stop_codon:yes gene_type:complete
MDKPLVIIKLYIALAIFAGVLYQTRSIFDYELIHNNKLEYKRENTNKGY